VRLDPEILGQDVVADPSDLPPGAFLSGAEAWRAFRAEEIDATTFGVYDTENFGPAEIQGNLIKDLAALNKVEMLLWDEWERMTEPYAGQTGPHTTFDVREPAASQHEFRPHARTGSAAGLLGRNSRLFRRHARPGNGSAVARERCPPNSQQGSHEHKNPA
jgi:hypothetical protein